MEAVSGGVVRKARQTPRLHVLHGTLGPGGGFGSLGWDLGHEVVGSGIETKDSGPAEMHDILDR